MQMENRTYEKSTKKSLFLKHQKEPFLKGQYSERIWKFSGKQKTQPKRIMASLSQQILTSNIGHLENRSTIQDHHCEEQTGSIRYLCRCSTSFPASYKTRHPLMSFDRTDSIWDDETPSKRHFCLEEIANLFPTKEFAEQSSQPTWGSLRVHRQYLHRKSEISAGNVGTEDCPSIPRHNVVSGWSEE